MKHKRELHFYSEEEVEFMRLNCKGRSYQELTNLFNEKFLTSLTLKQIKAAMKNRGFTNGRDARFKPGQVPHNKNKKGIRVSPETEFKPGHIPANYMPVGSERINTEGYLDVKVADPNKWRAKHRIVYEQLHGPVPKGNVIIFADGNKLNLDPNNLLMVTRGELAVMNHSGLIFKDSDLTKSGHLVARLKMKISENTRGKKAERKE